MSSLWRGTPADPEDEAATDAAFRAAVPRQIALGPVRVCVPVYAVGLDYDAIEAPEGTLRHKKRPNAVVRWLVGRGAVWLPWIGLSVWGRRCGARATDWRWPYMRTGAVWWRPCAVGKMAEITQDPDLVPWCRRNLDEDAWAFSVADYLDRVEGRPMSRGVANARP